MNSRPVTEVRRPLTRRHWLHHAFALVACKSLSACSGGGDPDGTSTPAPAVAAPPPTTTPSTPTSPATTPPAPSPDASSVPFKIERTGARYATLAQAVEVAISGDTIKVAPGRYVITAGPAERNLPGQTYMRYGIEQEVLTIEWEVPGEMPVIDQSAFAHLQGNSGGRPQGIYAGASNRHLTVRGLHLIGHPAGDSYGINSEAGYPSGNPSSSLTIEYCKLVRWADGVKNTYANSNASTYVRYTTIEDCTANSLTHGIYQNGALLEVIGCTFRTTSAGLLPSQNSAGHLLKSRTKTTVIKGSLFDPAAGCACCVDVPNGGALVIEGNVLLHYGAASNGDENPPIKFGAEQQAMRIVVSPVGGPLSAGDVVTLGGNGYTITITHVLGEDTYVYLLNVLQQYPEVGQAVFVNGALRGTITRRLGSPDGLANDGRVHSIKIAQNTFRKDQRSWNGAASSRIGIMWVWDMTEVNGNPIPSSATRSTAIVRNNIVAGDACGPQTVAEFPQNSAVLRSAINDLGVHSGSAIPGNPAVNDAALAWAGEFRIPTARTDTFRGGL